MLVCLCLCLHGCLFFPSVHFPIFSPLAYLLKPDLIPIALPLLSPSLFSPIPSDSPSTTTLSASPQSDVTPSSTSVERERLPVALPARAAREETSPRCSSSAPSPCPPKPLPPRAVRECSSRPWMSWTELYWIQESATPLHLGECTSHHIVLHVLKFPTKRHVTLCTDASQVLHQYTTHVL